MSAFKFGTDGIRGRANAGFLTCEGTMRAAMSIGHLLRKSNSKPRAVVGRDTRLSGHMFEAAMAAGLTSAGVDVLLLGQTPTPAVALLTRSLRADAGIMISASHNPYFDNGIKLFASDGYKLSGALEAQIEELAGAGMDGLRVGPGEMGRVEHFEGANERYVEAAKRSISPHLNLEGMRIVLDCANGAAYEAAPQALWELGAEVIPIGIEPNGVNINENCGSTDPAALSAKVKETGADIGIGLDGDADRIILCDERGAVVDGHQLLGVLARSWSASGRIIGGGVVSTVMANAGLERYLKTLGLELVRTSVGDHNVIACMREHKFNVGGEPCGHVILSDYATTGDGFLTALQAIACILEDGRPASEVCKCFPPTPQVVCSVYSNGCKPLTSPAVKKAIGAARNVVGGGGRLLVRQSGTEPVIRIMAEADEMALAERAAGLVAESIEARAVRRAM